MAVSLMRESKNRANSGRVAVFFMEYCTLLTYFLYHGLRGIARGFSPEDWRNPHILPELQGGRKMQNC
jgi:hypothetical protein